MCVQYSIDPCWSLQLFSLSIHRFTPEITIGISVVSTGFAFSRYIGSFHGPTVSSGLHSPNSASLFPTVIAVSLLLDIDCTSGGLASSKHHSPSLRPDDSHRKTRFFRRFPFSLLAIIEPRRSEEAEENPPATIRQSSRDGSNIRESSLPDARETSNRSGDLKIWCFLQQFHF